MTHSFAGGMHWETTTDDSRDQDQRIRSLIAAAKQAGARGQSQEAARLMRQAEIESPQHPSVQNEAALRLLASGNPEAARLIFQRIAKSERSNPELWFNLSASLRQLGRNEEALTALDTALAIDAQNLSALLEKGALEAQLNRPRAAAVSYRTALQMLPPGFTPPDWMKGQLETARTCIAANNLALETYIEDGLHDIRARYHNVALDRFDQCVSTMLQKRGIFRQQPTFMYFPELPTIEFYDRAAFPFLDVIEQAADDIRAELLELISDGAPLPYVVGQEQMAVWRELNNSRRWGMFALWREGKAYPENIARCPRTVEALKARPAWDIAHNGPNALFSILDAKTHIPPHTGPVNTRLVVHLPLIVPPDCRFRVGGTTRQWEPGKAFVFDDSINHEAHNESDLPRAVLIFDIWSPYLSAAERDLTRALTTRIGEYYGSQSMGGDL